MPIYHICFFLYGLFTNKFKFCAFMYFILIFGHSPWSHIQPKLITYRIHYRKFIEQYTHVPKKKKKFVSCKFIYKYVIEMSYIQRALSELVRFNFFITYLPFGIYFLKAIKWPWNMTIQVGYMPQYSFWRILTVIRHHYAFYGKSVSVSYPPGSIPDSPALQTTWIIVAHTLPAPQGTPRTVSGHL